MAHMAPLNRGPRQRLWGALRDAGQGLLDLLYPPRCAGCGRMGELLCAACQARIKSPPAPACSRCGRPGMDDIACPTCLATPSHLDRIAAAAIFAPPLREAIHHLKYENGRVLAGPLAALLVAAWPRVGSPADLIVPVPLHRSRQRERGYNQSALLAHALGQAVGLPVDEKALVRSRATRQQVGLGRAERAQNVAGAFACLGNRTGQRIVLIDDVCTTGSTLEACAEALRNAGAISVWAFALARVRWDPTCPPEQADAPAPRCLRALDQGWPGRWFHCRPGHAVDGYDLGRKAAGRSRIHTPSCRKGIRKLLKQLGYAVPGKARGLAPETKRLVATYLDQDRKAKLDWADPAQRAAQLQVLFQDAEAAVDLAAEHSDDADVRTSGWLLVKILGDDLELDDQGQPQIAHGTALDRIISITDAEMRHGRKSRRNGLMVSRWPSALNRPANSSWTSPTSQPSVATVRSCCRPSHWSSSRPTCLSNGPWATAPMAPGRIGRPVPRIQVMPIDLVAPLALPNDPAVAKSAHDE